MCKLLLGMHFNMAKKLCFLLFYKSTTIIQMVYLYNYIIKYIHKIINTING